jgi:hypothetical protein
MVVKFRNTTWPPPPQAIQTEHGPYIVERTQKAVYIMRCLCANVIELTSDHIYKFNMYNWRFKPVSGEIFCQIVI